MVYYILYPIFTALIPIFTFYNKNLGEAAFKDIVKLILGASISVIALFFLLTKGFNISQNISSGIILYLLILFYTPDYIWKRFFSYYYYKYIIKYGFYAVLVFLLVYIDNILPLIVTIITALVLVLNIIYSLSNHNKGEININPEIIDFNNISNDDKTDIYHIILDAYIGNTGIKAVSDFDNTEFYNDLRNLGFHVYENIYSNYNHTMASIPSLFTMDYIEYKNIPESQIKINRLKELIYSKTIFSLKNAGYTISAYSKWFFNETNSYISKNVIDKQITLTNTGTNETYYNFFKMTAFGVFLLKLKSNLSNAKYVIDSFDLFKDDITLNSPSYCFFHILAPHTPYSFHKDGTINNKYNEMELYENFQGEVAEAYFNHAFYTSKLSIKAFSNLIENIKKKNRKAVVFIHSDHGAEKTHINATRYNIILAEYTFGYDNKPIFHDNMSLINVFPMIFNYVFNANIPLKEEKFYDEHPYSYTLAEITDNIKQLLSGKS